MGQTHVCLLLLCWAASPQPCVYGPMTVASRSAKQQKSSLAPASARNQLYNQVHAVPCAGLTQRGDRC